MWIKWKYNDHGAGDFKELEVPKDVVKNYGSVEDYICELGLVPTHSERFLMGRIQWAPLRRPKKETVVKKILELKEGIKWRRSEVKRLSELL